MLFSYAQAREEELPKRAAQFVAASQVLSAPTGMIFSPRAHHDFMTATSVDKEIRDLINAVTDAESVKRVDVEIKRRIVTSKIPEELGAAMTEAVEVLGMQKADLSLADIPLIVTLYSENDVSSEGVIINVTGVKALADAMRLVWSKVYMSPFPDSTPQVAVAVMRMPPAITTARVSRSDSEIRIEAVEGWGRLVGTPETADVYVLNPDSLAFVEKHVNTQESMIARNERTEQIVKTSPFNASGQKITDDQIRSLAADVKRMDLSEAVFGLSNQKRWLLFLPQSQQARKPVSFEEPVAESFADEPEVEVVDLAEPEEIGAQEDTSTQEFDEVPGEPEDFRGSEEFKEEFTAQEAVVEEPSEKYQAPPRTSHSTSSQAREHTLSLGTQILEGCLQTIELTMREWLHGDDHPNDFSELITLVANKRQIPYKQRILSLWEMKRQGGFDSPDAESVRFGLETMERFVREFS